MSFTVDDEPMQHEPADHEADDQISFEGRRALLAEDNEINRDIARTILGGWGFAVDEAEDGKEALGSLKLRRPVIMTSSLWISKCR